MRSRDLHRVGDLALAGASALALRVCATLSSPWHAVTWAMLVPWLFALERTTSLRRTIWLSLLFCELFALLVFGWFATALQRYAESPAWLAWLALVLYAPLLQPQVWIHALVRFVLRSRGAPRVSLVLGSASAWVGAEWLVPKLFRDTLAHGLFPAPWLRQAADIAGVDGLTVVVVLVNECVLAGLLAIGTQRASSAGSRPRAALLPLGAAASLLAAVTAYGAQRHASLAAAREARRAEEVGVALVQGDLSHYARMARELGTNDALRRILDVHFALSERALAQGGVDLLVWPETVYPTPFGSPKSEAGAEFDRELAGFVVHAGVPLIFGTYDVEAGHEYNAAVFLEPGPDGALTFDAHRKAMLFPLTERVPVWLDAPWLRARLPWLGTWSPGPRPVPMEIGLRGGRRLRIAPLVCYDAVEPALAREAVRAGAELIVTLSNDAWFAGTPGARLHLAVSAFRSVETRRPQLRATNTGISASIDDAGEVVAATSIHARDALVARVVPRRTGPTLAMKCGDATGAVCATIAVLAMLAAVGGGLARRRVHER